MGKILGRQTELKWKPGLTWFLKFTEFVYVPAIRDRLYLRHLLGVFSKTITDRPDKHLKAASENLSNLIESRSSDLRQKLKKATGIDVTLQIPQTMLALLDASGLLTNEGIPLELRGDGIQSLAVSGILADLNSRQSSYRYIWGFEEPENSLEYIKAAELADEILESYSIDAQVFITTHSPAFIAMKNSKTSIYHVKVDHKQCEHRDHTEKYESTTSTVAQVFGNLLFDEVSHLSTELGFIGMMRQVDKDLRQFSTLKEENEQLKRKAISKHRPLLVVEGPNDCKTLRHAWECLYERDMPFDILGAGGAEKITKLLDSSRTGQELIFALYDHEGAGIKSIQQLSNCGFTEIHQNGSFQFRFKQRILARTLPTPAGRECNASNHNLSLEHYFSDDFLLHVDAKSGNKLFSSNNYIKDRRDYHVHEDLLAQEIDEGRITLCHRKLENEKGEKKITGKSLLVDCLLCLPNEDFEPFRALFEIIVSHLDPLHVTDS